jgi:cardiolipin synthase
MPDMPIVKIAASALYRHLIKAGVRIYEYCDRPLHGKVALTDRDWSTVGSSNLDPLSLALNLEANVIIRDRAFNEELYGRLDKLMCESCKHIEASELGKPSYWDALRGFVAFHLIRLYPSVPDWLPRHSPRLSPARDDALQPACAVPGKGGQ